MESSKYRHKNNQNNKNNKNNEGIVQGLKTLIFPEICIMCQQKFESICGECQNHWTGAAMIARTRGFTTYSVVTYGESVSSVVLKAKEDQNRIAQELISQALVTSISAWKKEIDLSQVLLVPIPSSKRAIRRRGHSFLHPIIKKVITRLSDQGIQLFGWSELLVHTKRVRDQAGLTSLERERNLRDSFAMKATEDECDRLSRRPIIIVDDVVTTGATLSSAYMALRERKMTVLGASTACASAHQLLIR
jgi:predicted amidophosphoribosyltransferase